MGCTTLSLLLFVSLLGLICMLLLRLCFAPAPPPDTGVAAWRAWLQRYGSAMPLLPKQLSDLPPLMSRRQALDRFEQHTKHCPDCQKVRGCLRLAGGT